MSATPEGPPAYTPATMSRFALAALRAFGALAAGAAAWTTFWVIRGGEPGPTAYVASLAVALLVYVAASTPAPRSWAPVKEPETPPDAASPGTH